MREVVDEIGKVTGRVAPGVIGEVMIPYKGGTEAFHAYSCDTGETIEVGREVVVVKRVGERSVLVTPIIY